MNKIVFWFCVVTYFFFQPLAFAYKPYNELEITNVTMETYPNSHTYKPGVEVTIGDLHGNALKLVYFLISTGVMNLPKDEYKQLVTLYKKLPEELLDKDLSLFRAIIDNASLNTSQKIRFLGDDLCDRGMNDYYTLYIYNKLDTAGVPFDVVLSNHGNFFLTAYEKPEHLFSYNPYGEGVKESLVQSMLNMEKLISKGLVDRQNILNIIQNNYLKHLRLPGYIVNTKKNEMTLYTHAPVDLKIIAALAQDLNIPFDDSNMMELTLSIENINKQITQWIMGNNFTSHYDELKEKHQKLNNPSPLMQILWNRDYSILDRKQPVDKTYNISYVHGHDSMPNVFDLDNLFGKGPHNDHGPFAIHLTHS